MDSQTMTKDWTEIFREYKGLWIALAEDEVTVIAASKDVKEAYKEAKEKGIKSPIMFSVPKKHIAYIGSL